MRKGRGRNTSPFILNLKTDTHMFSKVLFILAGLVFCYTIAIISKITIITLLTLLFTIMLLLAWSGFVFYLKNPAYNLFQEDENYKNMINMLVTAIICIVVLIILITLVLTSHGDIFSSNLPLASTPPLSASFLNLLP